MKERGESGQYSELPL